DSHRQALPDLSPQRVLRLVEADGERLDTVRPVLARCLAQQLHPETVRTDVDQLGSAWWRDVGIAHHDEPDRGADEVGPAPAPIAELQQAEEPAGAVVAREVDTPHLVGLRHEHAHTLARACIRGGRTNSASTVYGSTPSSGRPHDPPPPAAVCSSSTDS